jgi:hypothetical protein
VPKERDTETPAPGEVKRSKSELRERVAFESTRRARLAVPAFAGGILYVLGSTTTSATLKGLPTVGVVQGVAPALEGKIEPAVSPRAAEVKFYDHHVFGLLAGTVLAAAAIVILLLVLLFLFDVVRFRRPATNPVARWLILFGGIAWPLLTVVGEIVQTLDAHNFATGHDFTTRAVEHALTGNTLYEILAYATPLSALALVGGMVALMVATVRTGLQPRWLGIVGGAGAVILLIPSEELSLITAFWMLATGLVLMGRLPGGDPPAWPSGEARPWPSQVAARAAREERKGGGRDARAKDTGKSNGGKSNGASKQAEVTADDGTPAPVQPAPSGGGRRRRKRGSRS